MALFFFVSSVAFCTERITFGPLRVYPYTEENRELLEELVWRAARTTEDKYGRHITISAPGSGTVPDFSVEITATLEKESEAIVVSMKRKPDGDEPRTFSLLGGVSQESAGYLSGAIFYLWASFHGGLAELMEDPPKVVFSLDTDELSSALFPGSPAMLVPTSVSAMPEGRFLCGFSLLCVELDRYSKISGQPGRSLYEEGDYSYAYGVAATPEGTIYLKPAMGRGLYRIPAGSDPEKLRPGIDGFGPFAVLTDGSIVITDMQKKKAYRLDDRQDGIHRYELPLFQKQYSYPQVIAPGPEGTLWVFEAAERRVKILSSSGETIDSLIPFIDNSSVHTPLAMAVYADGSFVLSLTGGSLACFRRDGTPVWSIDEAYGEAMPQSASIAVDSVHGFIYLTDTTGKRVLKLLDKAYCRLHDIENTFEEEAAGLRSNDTAESIVTLAGLYEEHEAYETAKGVWEEILKRYPGRRDAAEKLDAIETAMLRSQARAMREKTESILNTIGPETARDYYSRTLRLFEKLLARDPLHDDIRKEMNLLRERFYRAERGMESEHEPFTILEVKLENLFPALMQLYGRSAAGSIRLKNSTERQVGDLKVSVFIKRFMDYPTESDTLLRLRPGEETVIGLPLLLNTGVLELDEDLPVQALLKLTCTVDGKPYTKEEYKTLTIYRRTALLWDDSGKISSFITPNEEIVSGFSHRVLSAPGEPPLLRLPSKLMQAMKVYDALGAYGISYIEDPFSPISDALLKKKTVDTVRFPRTTLLIKSGDCDDTTALTGSLFESAGIRTAIMTSPGHIFCAFDTEEPYGGEWMLESETLRVIRHDGTLWLPIETTVTKKGFMVGWEEASRLLDKYENTGGIEFLPLDEARRRYPPLPLARSGFSVVEPQPDSINRRVESSIQALRRDLYYVTRSRLEREARQNGTKERGGTLNRLGVLHARFGYDGEAEKAFLSSMETIPAYTPPYVNLANLRFMNGDIDGALDLLSRALDKSPRSVPINLLLACCYHERGDAALTRRYFAVVEERAPQVASRYSYLLKKEEAGRAREPDSPGMLWAYDAD
jgi:tetratricopeptide (TPR) repeat protein